MKDHDKLLRHVKTENNTVAALLADLPPNTRRAIRRPQLKAIVPISDTTLWEMEQRGDFPKRFYITPRCAAWDLDAILAWLEKRIQETTGKPPVVAPMPDAHATLTNRANN